MQSTKSASARSLAGIHTLLLTVAILATLHVGRDILIPLAMATLLAFLLAPLVTFVERGIGRIAAVLAAVLVLFAIAGFCGWVLTRQVVDLGTRLPDYKMNIKSKIRDFRVPEGGAFGRLSDTVDELKDDVAGVVAPNGQTQAPAAQPAPPPAPPTGPFDVLKMTVAPLIGPLGTAGLVLLLLIFILLQREDLRARMIRLIGKGHISGTTRAMEDAGDRVSRYLRMQLLVNVTYGIPVAVGLYFIGVPNAILFGGMATILRFIPYAGPVIAAAIPIVLSLAVFNTWTAPLMVIGLFVVLELISNNLMEPWLYGSSTGVSSIALIVATVFWTWLWGPMGLVLAAPLTVCLAVMGHHVPRLEFLSVLLSSERALLPAEELYQRLLARDMNGADALVENFLRTNTHVALIDDMLIPAITTMESEFHEDSLDGEQRSLILQSIRELVEVNEPAAGGPVETEAGPDLSIPPIKILCVPAKAERDEVAGVMLHQVLRHLGFDAETAPRTRLSGELVDLAEQSAADAVVISVVAPTTVTHARHLCKRLRVRIPALKIHVGLWGITDDLPEITRRLRLSGADEIVSSMAEAAMKLSKIRPADA